MQGFMPRFRRRVDRNNWVPIAEGGGPSTMARNGSITTSARLDGPPNFNDPIEPRMSPPPTYAQVRDLSKPEVANLMVHNGSRQVLAERPHVASSRRPSAPTAKMSNLNDIQHIERRVPMDNRLSSVPSYPVFLDAPSELGRSRRRSSISTLR